MPDLITLITHHRTEMTLVSQLHRLNAKTCSENAIQSGGRATALQMTENTAARFFTGAPGDFPRHDVANPAKPKLASFHIAFDLLAILGFCPLGHYYKSAMLTAAIALSDHISD